MLQLARGATAQGQLTLGDWPFDPPRAWLGFWSTSFLYRRITFLLVRFAPWNRLVIDMLNDRMICDAAAANTYPHIPRSFRLFCMSSFSTR